MSPGRRNVAGEKPCIALKPPHPVANNKRPGVAASRRTFLFSLTEAEYRLGYNVGNTQFPRTHGLCALTRAGAGNAAKQPKSIHFMSAASCLVGKIKPGKRRSTPMQSELLSLRTGRLLNAAKIHLLVFCTWLLVGACASAQVDETERVRATFRDKQTEYKDKEKDAKAAWQFGQACFDLADVATNKAERAQIAQLGIDACRKSVAVDSNSAPAHYFLSLNLGQLARTRSLGALRLVSQMEKELLKAIELDAKFDYAGPERTLGLLYRDAPSFGSIGSRSKARQHLQKAAELAPSYPDNRLSLLESYLQWGDRESARSELKTLEESLPNARLEFHDPVWKPSWDDWDERLRKVKKKLDEG
jgi:tetratricopeptide (TPR) repeat protein